MITHSIPDGEAAPKNASAGQAPECPAPVNQGRHGPFCVPLCVAARRQRAGVDSGIVPRGARARRVRGALLLSDAGPAGARCRRQRVAEGNRDVDRALFSLLGGTRTAFGCALWHERGAEDRRRGEGDPHRAAEKPCRHQGRDRLCRPGPQIPDLGVGTLSRGTRGGHREGPRAEEAARLPGSGGRSAWSTGMMTSGDSGHAVAGGLARHIPVLIRPAVELLAVRSAGGYSREILAAASCNVVALDRDQSAIARGADLVQASGGRLVLVEDKFSNLAAVTRGCGYDAVDGVVLDLGVSSMQLDQAERGFSFRHDGPLDMRMGSAGPSAADVLASASERDLATILAILGEERHARAVARAIIAARGDAPVRTTRALADIVTRIVHARPGAIHPATRTFQALRIFVNEELAELAEGLAAAEQVLRPGGRLVVVPFHPLEDRIAKSFSTERSRRSAPSRHVPDVTQSAVTFHTLTKRPIVPDEAEISANPRARSAKLRAAERTDAPIDAGASPGSLPRVPALSDVVGRQGSGRSR